MSVLTGDNPFADLKEKKGPCWSGYKKVPGKKDFEDGSCVKAEETETKEKPANQNKPEKKLKDMRKDDKSWGKSSAFDWHANMDEEAEEVEEDKKGHYRSTEAGAGMTSKGVAAVNAKTGGNLKTAVTGKVKPGSKAAGRRKSFCARSKGWNGERGKAARRRWKC